MKICIDTDTDSYEVWSAAEKLIEDIYHQPVRPLTPKPGGKESGTTISRWNIL